MGRLRVLVIDDEPDLRTITAAMLRSDGHDVQTAVDGKEGLALIGRNPFDLILCDLRMPAMDGAALYEEVRRDHPQALKRIVCVTAQAHSPEYGPFLREVDAPVLEKPFTPQQLRQIVSRMTGPSRYR
jgi:two-component system NtrC family sensor kinase